MEERPGEDPAPFGGTFRRIGRQNLVRAFRLEVGPAGLRGLQDLGPADSRCKCRPCPRESGRAGVEGRPRFKLLMRL